MKVNIYQQNYNDFIDLLAEMIVKYSSKLELVESDRDPKEEITQ
ncbi:hypothetical protein ACWFRC_07500 [Bacillus cereus]